MDELRVIRERKGLTLSQLAARASIPGRLLVEYEEGQRVITQQHLRALARVLYVNPEDIKPHSTPRPPSAEPAQPSNNNNNSATQPQVHRPPVPSQNVPPRTAEPQQVRPVPQEPVRPPAQPAQEHVPIGAVVRPAPPTNVNPVERPPQERRFAPPPPRQGHPPRPREEGMGMERTAPERPPRGKPREAKAPPPPQPITPGQINELLRLGARREMSREAIETRIGKPLDQLTRPDARQWIGTLRNEDASDVSVARSSLALPEVIDAFESEYLREMRDRGTPLHFLLFNGQQLTGTVVEFTPYTITIKDSESGDEVTLRKLAIVYYRKEAGDNNDSESDDQEQESEQTDAETTETV
jgi:transcriptional regulator with XRE-family HTH domain/sRNA-binding regulator protein Hfq